MLQRLLHLCSTQLLLLLLLLTLPLLPVLLQPHAPMNPPCATQRSSRVRFSFGLSTRPYGLSRNLQGTA
jgi:hypothetical protein